MSASYPNVAAERARWSADRQPERRTVSGLLIFIDEPSLKTNMIRRRGRCARGARLKASAPFGQWRTQTVIAALRIDGIIAP